MTNRVQAAVDAVNKVNRAANELSAAAAEALKPMIGKQVLKASGQLTERAKKLLPAELACGCQWWSEVMNSRATIWLTVRGHVTRGDRAEYHKTSVVPGKCDPQTGKLVSLDAPEVRRTDYTVEEVQAKQKAIEDAREALRDAQSAVRPFDERYY